MSDPRALIVERIDRSLDMVASVPQMWGSPESMELQVLLLLEMRAVASRPSVLHGRPSGLRYAYERFIRQSFDDSPSMLLSSFLRGMDNPPELHVLLKAFADSFDTWLPMDGIDEGGDLVLDLEAGAGPIPFALVCRYFDQFQNGLQKLTKEAVGSQKSKTGMAALATSYAIPEITVIPGRGMSPIVRLQLTQPRAPQTNLYQDEYESSVVVAMKSAAKVLRWAGGAASMDEVRQLSTTPEERMELAFQAMKMIPGAGIASVRIGGRLLGTTVEMRPQHAEKLLSVVQEGQRPSPFEQAGHVRALDLDQGWFRINASDGAIKCWVRDRKQLLDVVSDALAQRLKIRVRGQRFGTRARKWVVAESLDRA